MKVSSFTFLLLFYFVNSDDSLPCRFSDGSFGKCVDIRSCKSLYTMYRQGTIKIKDMPICDSVRRLVCCPRISAKKCKEYGRSALEIARIPSLIGDSVREIIIRTKCTHIPASLIVGGEEAKLYEFPHQALLGYQSENEEIEWLCGGSLISPNFVLTAAHCISLPDYRVVKFVKFAVHDRSYDGNKTVVSTVKETFKHLRGDLSSYHNDIALIKLQESIEIDEFILPACLPTRPYNEEKAVVTGFGETGRGILSQKLMKVTLEKFNQQTCKNIYIEKFNEATMLCYGHHKERKDSCTGDSGGPLQVSNHEQVNCTYTQIGIVSIGPNICGLPGAAAAYVNVYKFLDWIEGIVWKDEV